MTPLTLQIGIGGIIGNEMMTFDFVKGESLKPYVCEITGRCFKYGFKREFVKKEFTSIKKKFQHYGDAEMRLITFQLKRHVAYEYKRFAGLSPGEIEEGYFVILTDKIMQIEYDELVHWCGTAKEKERRMQKQSQQLSLGVEKYAKDDVDF